MRVKILTEQPAPERKKDYELLPYNSFNLIQCEVVFSDFLQMIHKVVFIMSFIYLMVSKPSTTVFVIFSNCFIITLPSEIAYDS